MTQEDLAAATGYSHALIGALEHNRRLPDVAEVIHLYLPALDLGEEPLLATQLVELAAQARGDRPGTNPISEIGPGQLKYISYTEFQDTDNGRFFHLKSGGWVEVSSRVSVPRRFPGGVLFDQTPERSFGWILPFNTTVKTKRTPGYDQDDYTDHEIAAYDRVQIYAVEAVGDTEWYLVGPDEWLDQRVIGRVLPNQFTGRSHQRALDRGKP